MRGILADHNIEGHFRALVTIWETGEWREDWEELDVAVESFQTLGIPPELSEAELWQMCQARGIILLTANRNNEGPDSLEATIRQRNTASSLPVFTLANPTRLGKDRVYADEIAVRLLDYLLDIDNYRGTGRLYV